MENVKKEASKLNDMNGWIPCQEKTFIEDNSLYSFYTLACLLVSSSLIPFLGGSH